MENDKTIFLPIAWLLYPIGIVAAYLSSGEALLLVIPLWFFFGIAALFLSLKKSPYKLAYIITGLVGVGPWLFLFILLLGGDWDWRL